MTVQKIKDRWVYGIKNAQYTVEWWNGKADSFASKELPTADNNLAMHLITDNYMLEKRPKMLDMDCGDGRFSFALEQSGKSGFFSPND